MNITDLITASRHFREKLLSDPVRPAYHFTIPGDIGIPGDSNGCFYAGGRYHLMYLYDCREDSFRWGHVIFIPAARTPEPVSSAHRNQ